LGKPCSSAPGAALGLVVVARIPLELACQVQQLLLFAPGDEFLQRQRDGGPFCAFAADGDGAVEQIRVQGV